MAEYNRCCVSMSMAELLPASKIPRSGRYSGLATGVLNSVDAFSGGTRSRVSSSLRMAIFTRVGDNERRTEVLEAERHILTDEARIAAALATLDVRRLLVQGGAEHPVCADIVVCLPPKCRLLTLGQGRSALVVHEICGTTIRVRRCDDVEALVRKVLVVDGALDFAAVPAATKVDHVPGSFKRVARLYHFLQHGRRADVVEEQCLQRRSGHRVVLHDEAVVGTRIHVGPNRIMVRLGTRGLVHSERIALERDVARRAREETLCNNGCWRGRVD
eukprot:7102430-Prymnesium_polylepis.2